MIVKWGSTVQEYRLYTNGNWLRLHSHGSDLSWKSRTLSELLRRKTGRLLHPPSNAVVVIGSSSTQGLHGTIEDDLPPITVLPRGFGGSAMKDTFHCVNQPYNK